MERYKDIIIDYIERGMFSGNNKLWRLSQLIKSINRFFEQYEGNLFFPDHIGPGKSIILYYLNDYNKKRIYTIESFNYSKFKTVFNSKIKIIFHELLSVLNVKNRNINFLIDYTNVERQSKIIHLLFRVIRWYQCVILGAKRIDMDLFMQKINVEYNLTMDRNYYTIIYDDIHSDLIQYKKSNDQDEKSIIAKSLFEEMVFIGDFYNAEKWYNILIDCYKDSELDLYKSFWKSTSDYLNYLEGSLSGNEHVVVNWIDAVRYSELCNATFLNSEMHKGLFFENMYSSTSYTSATMRDILTGQLLIDDRSFERRINHYSVSELCENGLPKILEKNGYKILYYGFWVDTTPIFVYSNSELDTFNQMYGHSSDTPSTLYQLLALEEMAFNKEKLFVIVHSVPETHEPYASPFTSSFSDDLSLTEREEIIKKCLNYIDDQMNYYCRFFRKCKFRIYMSDHGKLLNNESFSLEKLYHVIFSVVGNGIEGKVNQVYSHIEFSEILDKLFNKDYSFETGDEDKAVIIQRDDAYNLDTVNENIEKYRCGEDIDMWIQHRGLATKKDLFCRFADGRFFYENKDIPEFNSKSNEHDRIKKLSERTGRKFIDIYKEDKYINSRKMYEELGIKRAADNEYV